MPFPTAPTARRLTRAPIASLAVALLLSGCGSPDRTERAEAAQPPAASARPTLAAADADSSLVTGDTAVPTPIAASLTSRARGVRRRPLALSPRAESLATRMVFVPRTQSWFVTAARGKRMLVDVGRVDANLKGDTLRRAAYREAAERLSPLPVGALLRLRGPWGSEDATVTGFDVWNGRIVATLAVSPSLDSLARRRDPLVGTALRLTGADSLAAVAAAAGVEDTSAASASAAAGVAASPTTMGGPPPKSTIASGSPTRATDSPPAGSSRGTAAGHGGVLPVAGDSIVLACRDTMPDLLRDRATLVRDSLELELRTTAMPPQERLHASVAISASQAQGCFGPLGRMLLVVSLRAGANEWVRERLVALDDSGRVAPVRVSDYRFKAHDALYAFDADGDGVDDLAARGLAERSGATVVLRLDPTARRAERIAGGFAWEAR